MYFCESNDHQSLAINNIILPLRNHRLDILIEQRPPDCHIQCFIVRENKKTKHSEHKKKNSNRNVSICVYVYSECYVHKTIS